MEKQIIEARAKAAYGDLIYRGAGGAASLCKTWTELTPEEQERFRGAARLDLAREAAKRAPSGSAIAVILAELDRLSKDFEELKKAADEAFSACMSAWSCGEPPHRVRDMLDRTDELGSLLRRLKG